jgi:hypothetical protein
MNKLFKKFYSFLQERDAKLYELFFLCLNIYGMIVAFYIVPIYLITSTGLTIRTIVQLFITLINLHALVYGIKIVRLISAVINTTVLAFISISLIDMGSKHAGTYVLLMLLAMLGGWKIATR